MLRRRFLRLLGVGGVVAGSAATGHLSSAIPAAAASRREREHTDYAGSALGAQRVVWSVTTDEPFVAFTFDDGPDSTFTPRVLDLLGEARATFFLIGRHVERHPDLARRLVAAGHELGNHSWSHQNPAVLSSEATRTEIERGASIIERVTGVTPVWYRPPRGMVTGSVLRHSAHIDEGVAMWSLARGHSADGDVDAVRGHIVNGLAPGVIVELHDGIGSHGHDRIGRRLTRRRVAELAALPGVLVAAKERGLRFVTLSELVQRAGPVAQAP